jgi:protein arginine kinase activator
MLCQNCNLNPATVFIQKVINGEKREFHLCTECAKQFDVNMSFDKLFQGFLDTFLDYNGSDVFSKHETNLLKDAVCHKCGLSYEKFRAIGKLGCDECYNTFRNELFGLLKNIQGSTQHNGKVPKKIMKEFSYETAIENLKKELNKAIKLEEYEEAARLRDEIKRLKKSDD